VIAAFREWFNKAPPRRATLLDWEKRASEVRIFWVYGDFSATLYTEALNLVQGQTDDILDCPREECSMLPQHFDSLCQRTHHNDFHHHHCENPKCHVLCSIHVIQGVLLSFISQTVPKTRTFFNPLALSSVSFPV